MVPTTWKHAVIFPAAEGSSSKVLNDFRPVALTFFSDEVL